MSYYKRKYSGSNSSSSKRRRTSGSYTKSKSKNNRRRRSNYRRKRSYYRRNNVYTPRTGSAVEGYMNMKHVVKQIHVPQIRYRASHNQAVKAFKLTTNKHFITNRFVGDTSNLVGTNSMCLRIHPGLTAVAWGVLTPSGYTGWTTKETNTFGSGYWAAGYPTSEEYLWAYTKMKVIIRQVNEDLRIRMCIARPTTQNRGGGATNPIPKWQHSIDVDQDYQFWTVLYQKKMKFDTPLYSETAQLRGVREYNFYLPFNRFFKTTTGTAPTEEGAWDGGIVTDYSYIIFDSDDATKVDNQYAQIEVRLEHNFYMINT